MFTAVFTAEMLVKVFALGFKRYIKCVALPCSHIKHASFLHRHVSVFLFSSALLSAGCQ